MLLPLLCLSGLSAAEPTSFFSTLEKQFVAVVESSEWEDEPGIDHFRHICPGYGGYELVHQWFDARSWIDVRKGDVESDLYQSTMNAPGGTFPAVANDVVEWRGIVDEGNFEPYAIIYRLSAGKVDSDDTFTKLIIVGLAEGSSEILGAVSGEDENDEARRIADSWWKEKSER